MLYVLEDPQGRVAILRLEDRGTNVDHGNRVRCLRGRTEVHGVALADARVIGTSAACDWDAHDQPTNEEQHAAYTLLGRIATRGPTPWVSKPADWADRLVRARVGLFGPDYVCTLETVRERQGYIARPRYPDDPPGAYDRALAWMRVGPAELAAHVSAANRLRRQQTRGE